MVLPAPIIHLHISVPLRGFHGSSNFPFKLVLYSVHVRTLCSCHIEKFSALLEVSCIFYPLDISSAHFSSGNTVEFCVCVCLWSVHLFISVFMSIHPESLVWHISSLYASIKSGSDIPPVCFYNTHTSPTQHSPHYIITVDLFTPYH